MLIEFRLKVTGTFMRQFNYLLSMWHTYYHLLITFCISMIGSFEDNRSLSFFSVTENSKKNISVNWANKCPSYQKITHTGRT